MSYITTTILVPHKGDGEEGGDGGHPEHPIGGRGPVVIKGCLPHPAVCLPIPSSSGLNIKASTMSNGGGNPYKLPKLSPFAGRRAGGGMRKNIFGTSRYGSGYPYGNSGPYVAGRPLVYVFWPVPIQRGYYGGDEYARNQTERPGGNVTVAMIKSNSSTVTDTYRIIGDAMSVDAVYGALSSNCGIVDTRNYTASFTGFDETAFNATNNVSLPKPEQVIQWYRASTFGLALDGYNNTAALRVNMPASSKSALPSIPKLSELAFRSW